MPNICTYDPYLAPYRDALRERLQRFCEKKQELVGEGGSLSDFANAHLYFGFHLTPNGFVYREWAPRAERAYFFGDFNGWDRRAHPMEKGEGGVFTVTLPSAPRAGSFAKVIFCQGEKEWERIPLYATEVVQNENGVWAARIPSFEPFSWRTKRFLPKKGLYIYECHIGMAQEEGRVGTYREFREKILPRIHKAGYNTLQIMAIMEHPYYGSFGYQVSNFYAVSSRFGTPDELKELIDAAHGLGIAVLLDVVHSHAVKNTAEGIFRFDGSDHQFFHTGARGDHPAWDTKLFDYGKNEVLHFLLSNLKFYLTEYRFDGFRFDGVTSMLYRDHALGASFVDYSMYFSENTDEDALLYLQLANDLIHECRPDAITVAEDMSGMPGMCLPIEDGGIGFDYRLAMGVPDLWIRWIKELPDEAWSMGHLWFELTRRRPKEKNIGYAESHDQALVGDKTLLFRLCDSQMYSSMSKSTPSHVIDRGIALHKMIRLVTLSLAGEGYLNFMGNEFGHPEWIDFPREGNGWSYTYCRRQWHLADDDSLRYGELLAFDGAMLALAKKSRLFFGRAKLLLAHEEDKILAYEKAGLVFVFNFHPNKAYEGYPVPAPSARRCFSVLSTDEKRFGGWDRQAIGYEYAETDGALKLYLPPRTAIVLKKSMREEK